MSNIDDNYICIPKYVAILMLILFMIFSQSKNFVLSFLFFITMTGMIYTILVGDIILFDNSLTDTFMLLFVTEPMNFLEFP